MILGIIALAWANWQMSLFTPGFDRTTFYVIVFVHGLGMGSYFVPLTVITFSTLPQQYTDVGTGLYTLARMFGSSVGVSLTVAYVVRETQANHAMLGEHASRARRAAHRVPAGVAHKPVCSDDNVVLITEKVNPYTTFDDE